MLGRSVGRSVGCLFVCLFVSLFGCLFVCLFGWLVGEVSRRLGNRALEPLNGSQTATRRPKTAPRRPRTAPRRPRTAPGRPQSGPGPPLPRSVGAPGHPLPRSVVLVLAPRTPFCQGVSGLSWGLVGVRGDSGGKFTLPGYFPGPDPPAYSASKPAWGTLRGPHARLAGGIFRGSFSETRGGVRKF